MKSIKYLFVIAAFMASCNQKTSNNADKTAVPLDSALNGDNAGKTPTLPIGDTETLSNPAGMNRGEGNKWSPFTAN